MSEDPRLRVPQDRPNLLREAIFVIFYHKRLFLFVAVSISLLFLVLAVILPAQFQCQAKFSASMSEQMDPLQKTGNWDSKNEYTRMLSGQREIILSNRVLMMAAKAVYPGKSEAEYQKMVKELDKKIEVTPPKGESFEESNNFYLTYANPSPDKAFDMVNAVASSYLDVYAQIAKSQTEFSYEFFSKQVESLGKVMAEKADNLKKYEEKHALALVDILNLEVSKASGEMGTKTLLNEAQRKRQELQDEYTSLVQTISDLERDMGANNTPAILPDMEGSGRSITAYRNKVAQLRMQIKEMETQFTPEYVPLRRLNEELASNMTLLRAEVADYLRGKHIQAETTKSMLKNLDGAIANLEDSLRNTAKMRSSYEYLRSDYEIAQKSYAAAKANLELARQANSMSKPPLVVTMVDPPMLPTEPYKPNRLALAVLGLVLGISFGLAVIFLLDYFDHTIKTPEDIMRYGRLPMYGSLAHTEPK